MNRYFLYFILTLLFPASLKAQTSVNPLSIGEVHTIHSGILNEDRIINIYLPEHYDPQKSYPVIYLLDGSMNEDFLHITGIVQFFNLMFTMPDFIVAGISNVDRKRDFTFKTDLKDLKEKYPTTGYSAQFMDFIEKELQPYLNTHYKTENTRYLIGQSLGGLLASEILLKKPDLFTHYFIVSPSLWWDNESLLKNAPQYSQSLKGKNLYVYISAGKNEDAIMKKEAKTLFKILSESGSKNLKLDFYLVPKENHATILHNSIYQAFLRSFPCKY
ncbi:MAG: alpha/beta hydrolase [Bacteroidia bacterium]|nr:alpha/beta hydrolase [Bacteroidia bacterium]